jgi:hypothetical protein
MQLNIQSLITIIIVPAQKRLFYLLYATNMITTSFVHADLKSRLEFSKTLYARDDSNMP